jgi:hypothetical protein
MLQARTLTARFKLTSQSHKKERLAILLLR